MKLKEITSEQKTVPGEYIYHEPTKQIVLCGAFSRDLNVIRAFINGSLFADKIENFRKIENLSTEQRTFRRCKGCGK
jgi:hypothetical protein|tara:strand:- start:611 stop:841 length:231 start_codon:yes stop_codon:yes gene_type:complete